MIIALDSLDESANYVHISDVKDDVVYHCPCCKGIVKPRAYKKDEEYQVQPHFYHENGGCSEESFVHYICKTWLFENGCKFKIVNSLYTVSNIQTEKTLHTNFGDYRPDIIVDTDEGKSFFFEIKYSNKKTEHYIPKWDELETDVVEVDAREFINQKHNNDIPEFKLIYSDGYCFIKSYSHKDYEDTIAKRKIEWKRQDKLNYKIQWERLDWFWSCLQDYINEKCTEETVMQKFEEVGYDNIEVCWNIVSKMSCFKNLKTNFRNIVNKIVKISFFEKLLEYKNEYKEYFLIHDDESYCLAKEGICIKFYDHNLEYWNDNIRLHIRKWVILPSDVSVTFNKLIAEFNHRIFGFKRDEHIKKYITEEKFPLLFYDTAIEWDICDIPRNKNADYNDIIPYEEYDLDVIEEIIDKHYDLVKSEYSKSGLRTFTLKKVIDCVYEFLYGESILQKFSLYKKCDGTSISLLFCGSNCAKFMFNGFYVEAENFKLGYDGLKISEICSKILEYCKDIAKSISITFSDLVNDIIVQGNHEKWKMNYDFIKSEVFIEFRYTYNYLNNYLKTNIVNSSCNLNSIVDTSLNISLENYAKYRKIITDHLTTHMYSMLKDEIEYFEKTHESYGICIIDKEGNIIE